MTQSIFFRQVAVGVEALDLADYHNATLVQLTQVIDQHRGINHGNFSRTSAETALQNLDEYVVRNSSKEDAGAIAISVKSRTGVTEGVAHYLVGVRVDTNGSFKFLQLDREGRPERGARLVDKLAELPILKGKVRKNCGNSYRQWMSLSKSALIDQGVKDLDRSRGEHLMEQNTNLTHIVRLSSIAGSIAVTCRNQSGRICNLLVHIAQHDGTFKLWEDNRESHAHYFEATDNSQSLNDRIVALLSIPTN